MSAPLRLVIVGRPNVGKSTLFNRLLGRRRALVHDLPGVTRDRLEEKTRWWVRGKAYRVVLIDTGGLGAGTFADEIAVQVRIALDEADAALVVFDVQTGFTDEDREVVLRLRRSGLEKQVPVIGVANKVDAEKHEELGAEFFASGLDRIVTVSAEHGRGIDELQEAVVEVTDATPEPVADAEAGDSAEAETATEERIPRVAVVGRPNVGKSTFVNAILGENRMITSSVAGTTVDAVDSLVDLGGSRYVLIDTAGIRRKSKTEKGVEVLSVVQARKALERADLAILVLDGETGITDQDEKVGGLIEEAGCSVVLAVNKWDTQRDPKKFSKDDAAELIRGKMGFLKYAPILFMSAKRRQGLEKLGGLIDEILHQRRLQIPTHEFSEWVRMESEIHNPENAKFYLCHQSGRHPPTFVCHVNDPARIHFSLKRHLVNALRERWGYMGTPVRMNFVEATARKRPRRKHPTR